MAPVPEVSDVEESVQPPTVPPVAVMLFVEIVPVTFALLAVTAPALVTENAADVPVLVVAPAKNVNPLLALVPV